MIYNKSLEDGRVSEEWKAANVTAIFKKGSREEACNYRPVSLTSQVCKVLESFIRDQITEYLDKYDLLKKSQHGFMKKRSCVTNLLEFLDFVAKHVDCGKPVDVVCLDFQKDFDKVPHQRLKFKLDYLGIKGNIANWIEHWLNDRKQRVVLGGMC